MKSILDRLQQEICTRFRQVSEHNWKFGFPLDVEHLLNNDSVDKKIIKEK